MITHTRDHYLDRSLASLLAVDHIDKSQITVFQDGTHAGVAGVVRKHGLRLVQKQRQPESTPAPGRRRKKKEGADYIAEHYKYALSHLFRVVAPTAEFVIIVEEDMTFAPDFLDFFAQLAYLLREDPSLYCISSWNDNGFTNRVASPTNLYRTEFFLGLGWLLSRRLYVDELERRWPETHWDHWMREDRTRKQRECIFPEVPRNYHIGVEGTHMDKQTFKAFFAKIALNDQAHIDLGDTSYLLRDNYEDHVRALVRGAIVVDGLDELASMRNQTVVLYISAKSALDTTWVAALGHFGLWSSLPIRGIHRGMVAFRHLGNHVLLLSTYSPYCASDAASHAVSLSEFRLAKRRAVSAAQNPLPQSLDIRTADQGESCDAACARAEPRKRCSKDLLPAINTCDHLRRHFACEAGCGQNVGYDQPAYVVDPTASTAGQCLYNGKSSFFSCDGSHPATRRMCPCV